MFAKVMQRRYPRDNLYVGKVGCWLPWDPSEHVMPEVEYAEQELNELMRKYKENEANREIFFEEEKAEKIKNQRIENEMRKSKALEDALETAVHPAEGAIRDI
jgi:hypothetical protein